MKSYTEIVGLTEAKDAAKIESQSMDNMFRDMTKLSRDLASATSSKYNTPESVKAYEAAADLLDKARGIIHDRRKKIG
jgi:hypothetical protein